MHREVASSGLQKVKPQIRHSHISQDAMRLAFVFALRTDPAWAKEPIRVLEGFVSKVSDGDTVQVQDTLGARVKLRLYGIDAPETEKRNRKTGRISKPGQPYGEEAFETLKGKIGGQRVTVEVRDIDRYRREVSVVRLGGRDINQEMVREGFAWAYRQYLERRGLKDLSSGGIGPWWGGVAGGGTPAEGVAENARGFVSGGCSEGETSPF